MTHAGVALKNTLMTMNVPPAWDGAFRMPFKYNSDGPEYSFMIYVQYIIDTQMRGRWLS